MRRGEKRVHDKDISRRKKLIAIGNRCQENSSAAHMVLFSGRILFLPISFNS
jgi:hypothetical protein